MKTILNYILGCILEKKLRTALIVSAIMISSAMFFAALSISETLVRMQTDAFRQNYGYTDIVIRSGEKSPTRWFYSSRAEKYRKDAEYLIGEFSGSGAFYPRLRAETGVHHTENMIYQRTEQNERRSKVGTVLRGIDIDDLQKLTPFTMATQNGLYPFRGMKAAISSDTAEKYALKCGDPMWMEINGSKYRFLVCGIFHPFPALAENGTSFLTILPLNTLNTLYDARGRVDQLYLKLLDPGRKQRLMYLLSKEYGRYDVTEPFSEWELKREADRITAPVLIVTVILSFMCIYVIHTTFRIIVTERIPVIGILRCIGAERWKTDLILIAESILYGTAGGFLGCVSGIGLLYAIAGFAGPGTQTPVPVRLDMEPSRFAAAFGIAVFLSVAGSSVSIWKMVGIPVRDIVLGIMEKSREHGAMKMMSGCFLLLLSFLVPLFIPVKASLIVYTACTVLVLVSFNLLIPFLSDRIILFLRFLFGSSHANLPGLAARMLYKNGGAYSGIAMVMIGISGLTMISTLNWSQIRDNTVLYDRNRYEITLNLPFADKTDLELISGVEGVTGIMGNHIAGRTELEGFDEPIWHIQGIRVSEFTDFQFVETDQLATLDKGRTILLTNMLKERLGVELGQTILLKFPAGNGGFVRRSYRITGFFNTMIKGMWSYALISERNFRTDIHDRYFGSIYIKTDREADKVINGIKAEFPMRQPVIERKEDARKADLQSSSQLFFMLQGFTLMTLVTGAFGIWNLLFLRFLQRRRQFAMLRSCGMSRRQLSLLIVVEAVIQGVAGSFLGIVAGVGTTWLIVPRIIRALNLESSISFSPVILLLCFFAGLLAYIPTSAFIASKASGMNLIQAIRQD